MTTLELLSYLNRLDIQLWTEDGRLRYSAPEGALTSDLKSTIKDRKTEIIKLLEDARQTEKTLLTASPTTKTDIEVRRVSRDQNLPISFSQQRFWFLDRLEPGNPAFHIPLVYRLKGHVNIPALESALSEIVRRHESLRTTFATYNREQIQVIAPKMNITAHVVDLRSSSPEKREEKAAQLGSDEAKQQFDLLHGPLFRIKLLRIEDQEHLLLLTMHHIISDGWSLSIFIKELAILYKAFVAGKSSPLPDLPIQYADYTIWQRQTLTGDRLQFLLDYWKKKLAPPLPILQLPTDFPRPPVLDSQGSRYYFRFSETLSQRLSELSRKQGITLFMTLISLFNVLLYRYSNQTDLSVGVPIANRNRSEIEGLIGLFVNTLVIRADLSHNPRFSEFLAQIKETALESYEYQDLPFEKLVEELSPERDLSRSPIFQVMFALQNAPSSDLKLPGVTLKPERIERGTVMFDLAFVLYESDKGLHGRMEYNTDLFTRKTIQRMTERFVSLAEAVIQDPDQRLSQLPILSDHERRQILEEWNRTEAEFPDTCFHYLFEETVTRHADKPAVVFQDHELTFDQLNRRANQLAHYLRKILYQERQLPQDSKPIIGVFAERSIDVIVSFLAIMKAGAAYLPLDPAYPKERVAYMAKDAALPIILTQNHLIDTVKSLPEWSARILCLDSERERIDLEKDENPPHTLTPTNLAYVIYTSGSTGKPKGVLVEHRGVCNMSQAQIDCFGIQPGENVLQFSSLSFDASIFDMVMTLRTGARLCLGSQDEIMPGPDLIRLMKNYHINLLTIPPSALGALPPTKPEELPDLHTINVAGEACSKELMMVWKPGRRFFNLYGPTESTIWTTQFLCENIESQPPIGQPIANLQVYVLNPYLQPTPVGVPGELHIGGVGVARGYLESQESTKGLTAQKFIPDPFTKNIKGGRLYKTGDLARYLPDGNLEFLGRIDHQVKIRGFRIELSEIEIALQQHSQVKESLVVAHGDKSGTRRLVGYVAKGEINDLSGSELRRFLQQSLPNYMIPAVIILLDSFPLTPNGKIDRRALPTPEFSRQDSTKGFVSPLDDFDRQLARLWEEVLDVRPIGMTDHFFELGGHSLLATRLISGIQESFRIKLPLRELFDKPTISELSRKIKLTIQEQEETGASDASEQRFISIDRKDKEDPDGIVRFPLSHAQERLWFLDKLSPGDPTYNIPAAYRMQGTFDREKFEQSLQEIVNRHEILRAVFEEIDGQPMQAICPKSTLDVPLVDLQDKGEDQISIARQLVSEFASQPFDLEKGQVLRVKLLRLRPEEHIFLGVMHHIISDGWSFLLFFQELSEIYDAFCQGATDSPLPPLSLQYVDYTVWQRGWLEGEALSRQLSYWKRKLGGEIPVLEIPTDFARPTVQTHRGGRESIILPPELTSSLTKLSQTQNVTLFMTLLGAFKTLLSRYTGQTDILIGSPIAGRSHAQVEKLIGMFLNTLVLRTDLSGNPDFIEVLNRIRETSLNAYAHQDLPFEKLLIELRPERDLSRTPLFQVFFNMLNIGSNPDRIGNLQIERFSSADINAKFDLTLYVAESGDHINLTAVYNTDLFSTDRIQEMMRQYKSLLESVSADPQRPIDEHSLRARKSLLPDPTQELPGLPINAWQGSIYDRLHDQAERHPQRFAVIDQNEQWNYQELEQWSNRLAQFLIDHGVEKGDAVAIYANRCSSLVWAIMGTLGSGGVFTILDSTYPSSRLIDYMEATQPNAFLQTSSEIEIPEALETYLQSKEKSRKFCRLILPGRSEAIRNNFLSECSFSPPKLKVNDGDSACISFTSGSTGRPKGVVGSHGSLSRFMPWMQENFNLWETDRFSMFSGLSHDPLHRDVFTALWVGACICIPDPSKMLTPDWLINWTITQRITVAHITPAMGRILTWSLKKEVDYEYLAQLRYVFFIGDKLTREDVRRMQKTAPHATCVNMYGSTETQRSVSYLTLPPHFFSMDHDPQQIKEQPKQTLAVGVGIPGVQLLILNRRRQLAGIGELGEICIRSRYLAKGYLNDHEATAARFIQNSWSKEIPGQPNEDRIYCTGDLGRYLPDGIVEVVGRVDGQVKIRGFRIETGEIETILTHHPALEKTTVTVREDMPGGKQLIAYYTSNLDSPPPTDQLRRYLRDKLPNYMVPGIFVPLPEIPLTANGKIDYKSLPKPDLSQIAMTDSYIEPRNAVEKKLAEIWTDALGVDRVGIRDNFFDLGGHSMLAVSLFAKIEKRLGKKFPLSTLFQSPTVEHQASILLEEDWTGNWKSLVSIQPNGSRPPFFCVHGAGGNVLFFRYLSQYLDPDQPFYGLQSYGLDGKQRPLTRIEDMATKYIKEIRTIQPEGPYFLGGFCMGGMVAFEMARQLDKQGQKIGLVALLESHGPRYFVFPGDTIEYYWDDRSLLERLQDTFKKLIVLEPKKRKELIQKKINLAKRKVHFFFRKTSISASRVLDKSKMDSLQELRRLNIEAQKHYEPSSVFPGELHLFQATNQPRGDYKFDPNFGWSPWTKNEVKVHKTPGFHGTIIHEPNVSVFIEMLKTCLYSGNK
ncbi:MAG: hypothetical protein B6244_04175 [Candidatus Cloacimonetes bacterium 4572_55]|nr:MAG: hypothetical protein B6244_04175 [Candidatus Cloacimonetes bacterium 4572_55]